MSDIEMTQEEFDELYVPWKPSQITPFGNNITFKEFVENHRQQKAFQKASLVPSGIRIIK